MARWRSIWAIYCAEMRRAFETAGQSLIAPVLSTVLYFVVFGAAIVSRIGDIEGVSYGAFIVPGLIVLTVLNQSVLSASFGVYLPRFTGTIYEVLSAPLSFWEVVLGYVGSAASKALLVGVIVLATSYAFVSIEILHPVWMVLFFVMISVTFSLIGFLIGIWADSFERLQIIPLLIITPLAFLGGTFYSVQMLPEGWQTLSLCNPVTYLVSGFRWSFYGHGDVQLELSVAVIVGFFILAMSLIAWVFKTGYRLRN